MAWTISCKENAISQKKRKTFDMIKIRSFIEETMEEVRKCSWPNKDQLFESTLLVLFALVVVSAFVAAIDWVLFALLKLLTA
jgi:preprotein translocase subunit SecE